jgi:hypothetical protein
VIRLGTAMVSVADMLLRIVAQSVLSVLSVAGFQNLISKIWRRLPARMRRWSMRLTHARFTVTAGGLCNLCLWVCHAISD